MYLTGLDRRHAALQRRAVQMAAELPPGTHNARPFRDGVCSTTPRRTRCGTRGGAKAGRTAHQVPRYAGRAAPEPRPRPEPGRAPGLRARACVLSDTVVAGGSSPSTVSVYDLAPNERLLSVNLTMDVRNAIHGLAVWPFD